MEGAIGLEQLKKMDRMIAQRRENARYFKEKMKQFPEIRLQKEVEASSWFGFSLVLQGRLKGKRSQIVEGLRHAQVETRPIVAGNFTRNKVIEYMDYSIPAPLVNADEIHDNGFFIGNHSKNNFAEIDYFTETMQRILSEV